MSPNYESDSLIQSREYKVIQNAFLEIERVFNPEHDQFFDGNAITSEAIYNDFISLKEFYEIEEFESCEQILEEMFKNLDKLRDNIPKSPILLEMFTTFNALKGYFGCASPSLKKQIQIDIDAAIS